MNKSTIRHISALLCSIIPFRLLRKIAARDIVVVNYHSTKDSDYDSQINKQPYRTLQQFEDDVIFFKKHYNIVGLRQLIDYKRNQKPLPPNSLAITFDDGLAQVYNHFRPVLKKHGITAIIFINPPFIDQGDMHFKRKINLIVSKLKDGDSDKIKPVLERNGISPDNTIEAIKSINYSQRSVIEDVASAIGVDFKDYLAGHQLYLTSEQIETMVSEGFFFGGHSWDHPDFRTIGIDEQQQQVEQSTQHTAKRYNLDYKVFAFPYRDYHVTKELFERIEPAIDLTFGTHGLVDDPVPFHLQRTDVERSGLSTKTAMKLNYLKFLIQRLTGKQTLKRK
jgi:peptidoglycan/xylan/chitin deacetylase (PgdA/CDA1 family)